MPTSVGRVDWRKLVPVALGIMANLSGVSSSGNVVAVILSLPYHAKRTPTGETFCHTLHIMDSKGTSVLVNKKCTSERECQRTKVGCVEIDTQMMCVSCCDQNYCNMNVPTNSSSAVFDDKITKMRMLAKNLFKEREKALTTTIKVANRASRFDCHVLGQLTWLFLMLKKRFL